MAARMSEEEFEALYSATIDVLLKRVLTTYKGRAELEEVVERVMEFS